jgi:hypothetical protein
MPRHERTKEPKKIEEKHDLEKMAREHNERLREALEILHREAKHDERLRIESELNEMIEVSSDFSEEEMTELASDKFDETLTQTEPSSSSEEEPSLELTEDEKFVVRAATEIQTRSKEQKNLYAQYAIAGASVIGSLFTSATAIYAFITAKEIADSKSQPATEPNTVRILEIVKAWATKPDDQFWGEVAIFVSANEASISLSDEILFLKTIESISAQVSWIWPTTEAKNTAITTSIADYTQAKNRTATMYEKILSHSYLEASTNKASVLPRRIAAEILKLAVARIARTSA